MIMGRLPGNEVMEDEECRFRFWETQIDDTGRLSCSLMHIWD